MTRIPLQEYFVLAGLAFALAFCVHFLQATPALSATEPTAPQLTATKLAAPETPQPEALVKLGPEAIATAPQAPQLVPAILGGKPVHVLYTTRPDDVITRALLPHLSTISNGETNGRTAKPKGRNTDL